MCATTRPPAIFVDTRTQRSDSPVKGPVALVSRQGLQKIHQIATRANHKKGQQLLIVSPAPVYGYELVENVQGFLSKFSDNGKYKWDQEAWRSNEQGFVDFITFIVESLGPSNCIFLSGDVHYAFAIKASFTLNRSHWGGKSVVGFPYSLPIVQATSSSLKNTGLLNAVGATVSIPNIDFRQDNKNLDPE